MDDEMRPLGEQPDEEDGADDPFDALFGEPGEGGEPNADADDPLARLFEDTEDLFVDFDDDEEAEPISVSPDEDETGELTPPVQMIAPDEENAELIEALDEPPVAATDAAALFEDFDDAPHQARAEQEAAFAELFGDLEEDVAGAPAPDSPPKDLPDWLQEPAILDDEDTAAHAPIGGEPAGDAEPLTPAMDDGLAALFDGSAEGLEDDSPIEQGEEPAHPTRGLLAGLGGDEAHAPADRAPLSSPEPSVSGPDLPLEPAAARDLFADFDDAAAPLETSAAEEDLFALLDSAEDLDPFRELEAVEPPTRAEPDREPAAPLAPREPLPPPTSDETPDWLRELGIGEGEDLAPLDEPAAEVSRQPRRARRTAAPATNMAFGMTASQRLILAVFLFIDVAVLGLLALYAVGAVNFAF